MALCEEIKGAGIAPMAHQGKYPYYIQQFLMDLAVKHGGHEVIVRDRLAGAGRLEAASR